MSVFSDSLTDQEVPVRQFTTKKLIGVSRDKTVQDACKVMVDFGISALVVLDDVDKVVGFITQKDIISRVVAENQSAQKPVEEFMSPEPITTDIDKPVTEVLSEMAKHQITHMLITEGDHVRGIFTLKDYLDYQRQRLSTFISAG